MRQTMKHAFSLISLCLLTSTAVCQEANPSHWYADFDKAAAVAEKEGKDLLVDFTGSDWCGWCIRLDEEVFDHEAFLAPISKNYILLKLDFPNSEEVKAKVPNPERNAELSEKYNIAGFPTILLMNSSGEAFASTGYEQGGPESYVGHLEEIAASGKKALAAAKEIEKKYGTSKDKEAVVRKAVKLLAEADDGDPGKTVLAGVVRRGFELDPVNASGLKLTCLQTLQASGQLREEGRQMYLDLDPGNVKGLFESVVLNQLASVTDDESARAAVEKLFALQALKRVHDAGEVQGAALMAATWCNSERMLNEPEKAKSLAKWAKTLGEIPKDFQELVEELAPELQFRDGSCCDRAAKKGGVCGHPCCKKAAQEDEVCSKCN